MQPEHLATAAHVLSEALGSTVALRETLEFRADRVTRCAVEGVNHPSVIVKIADADSNSGLRTAWNEMAALRILGYLTPALVPVLLAADPISGLLVIEDFGDAPSLASILLSDDPDAARSALRAHASSLGALHAATVGHADEFDEIRKSLGTVDTASERLTLRGQHIGHQ